MLPLPVNKSWMRLIPISKWQTKRRDFTRLKELTAGLWKCFQIKLLASEILFIRGLGIQSKGMGGHNPEENVKSAFPTASHLFSRSENIILQKEIKKENHFQLSDLPTTLQEVVWGVITSDKHRRTWWSLEKLHRKALLIITKIN